MAGAREGWAYVWPRDAGAVAIAFASAGYRLEAGRIVGFMRRLDLDAAARFNANGEPVEGRDAQGDAAGWVAAARCAVGMRAVVTPRSVAGSARRRSRTACEGGKLSRMGSWRNRADYQEKEDGDYLGNAVASEIPSRRLQEAFASPRGLVRRAEDFDSGLDTAAAWAVRPFARPALFPAVRQTLLRLAAQGGRFGLLPSQHWDGGEDPWTAPTSWSAWSLAALAQWDRREGFDEMARRDRRAALELMASLRRAATPLGLLPERVDAETGLPASTTPLAWSHAFAILALRELWPGGGRG